MSTGKFTFFAASSPGFRLRRHCESGRIDVSKASEFWIIDRFQRIMTVYGKDVSPTGERVIAEHEIYQTPLLPGFEMPLARILATADAWS